MKVIRGIKFGGLQQKIFNLLLIFLLAIIGVYAAVSIYQQRNLAEIVQETGIQQQASIKAISEETMEAVLSSSLTQSTALQAYIADDLFADVRSDVLTLQAFAVELFEHADSFAAHPVEAPDMANDGRSAAMLIHEEGVDPEDSEFLGLVGNMSEIMLAMYEASDKLGSVFVGTADGNMVLVNDRSGTYLSSDGQPLTLDIRHRPWYVQAEKSGTLIFTDVELDAYTNTPMLECAAPVYYDGRLVAVVSADVFLTSIREYVEETAAEGGFVCVLNENGQVLFSPKQSGVFRVELSENAVDLRESEDEELAGFIDRAMQEKTGLVLAEIDGKEYYLVGTPMETLGWTVVSVVDKEVTRQPTDVMLAQYDEINDGALAVYERSAMQSQRRMVVLTVVIIVLAVAAGAGCVRSFFPASAMKKSDLWVVAVLYAFVAWFTALTLDFPPEAQTYPLMLLGCIAALVTLYLVLQILRWKKTGEVENDFAKSFSGFLPVQFFVSVLLVVGYLLAMHFVGYYIASVAYLVLGLLFLKVPVKHAAVTLAILMVVATLVSDMVYKLVDPKITFD